VRPSLNAILEPSVLRRIPGLSAKKREAGMATFWDVISGSMFVYILITYLSKIRIWNYKSKIQQNRRNLQILK
tara:strand:+ start:3889 stop:4107 length:219 start_codon:yes stop_codon:yes gene_type:complete